MAWAEFIPLMIEISSRLLWTRYWIFRFHKIQGNCRQRL